MVQTDSDWAGDRESRKSISGGAISYGGGLVKSWSKEQPVVALSSGEAELYAANRGAREAMGVQSSCKEMGIETKIEVQVDATATEGML